jgi:hypothetical protein
VKRPSIAAELPLNHTTTTRTRIFQVAVLDVVVRRVVF